jgi:hypothetical protein
MTERWLGQQTGEVIPVFAVYVTVNTGMSETEVLAELKKMIDAI